MPIRITDIRERTCRIASPIRNAYIDFSKMTAQPGRRRHQRGARRQAGDRLRLQLQRPLRPGRADPRAFRRRVILEADPASLLDATGENLDPDRIWAAMMTQREAGRARRTLGRGRHHRHGGVGRGGEDRRQAAVPPAGRAARARRPTRACSSMPPAATTTPARTSPRCAPRCAATSTAATRVVKMKIGGESIAEDRASDRGGAGARSARTRNWRSTPTAASTWRPRSPTPRCCATTRCSGTRKPAIRWTTSCRPRWRNSTPARWRPGRTCSATRTRAT